MMVRVSFLIRYCNNKKLVVNFLPEKMAYRFGGVGG